MDKKTKAEARRICNEILMLHKKLQEINCKKGKKDFLINK